MQTSLIIQIDLSSVIPAYQQITAEIRGLLVTGELAPGAAIPTVRELARDLNVHHNTVASAYRLLAAEGWLELRRRRGVRVLPRRKPSRSGRKIGNIFRKELMRLLAKSVAEGLSPSALIQQLATAAHQVKSWTLVQGEP